MRGLGGLVDAITNVLGITLAPWMAPAALVLLAVLAWPFVRINLRTDDARRILKNAARTRGDERERLEMQALETVRGRPVGLVVVAEEALKQGRVDLARRAVAELRRSGRRLPDLRRLEHAIDGPTPRTPVEACLLVERLLDTGLHETALARWEDARRRWPEDADLEALGERFTSTAPAGSPR